MKKSIFCLFILFTLSINCFQNKDPLNPLIPLWLEKKISAMENNIYYMVAVIYRHEWQSKYYYYFDIPVSSCAYCEVYDEAGKKMDWNESNMSDYLQYRKNEIIIWHWSR